MNKYGRTQWAKIVSADFRIKNRLTFGASRADTDEVVLASGVTPHTILKIIAKIQDEKGRPAAVEDMPEIIGRAYHDVITEELWNFLKKRPKARIDFRELRRLTAMQTRDIALAHFNGVPVIELRMRGSGTNEEGRGNDE